MLISWFINYYLYKKRSDSFVTSFLNSQSNISVLIKNNQVLLINDFGLKVFGYKDMKSFHMNKAKLVDFFLVEDGFISKYTYGEKWIEMLYSSNTVTIKNLEKKILTKVKIFSKKDMMERYYHIKVSQLPSKNKYIILFTDISQLEKDKLSLKNKSELDVLTGIYNRVKLNEILEEKFLEFNKFNHKFTLILFDIDHFKMINDNYGHNVGDYVLVTLTKLIQKELGATDTFVRWGGEEFVVILENVSIELAKKLANRLRLTIANHVFEEINQLTCSFGITEVKTGDTKELLFERVDTALYEAKENGRNQVVTK